MTRFPAEDGSEESDTSVESSHEASSVGRTRPTGWLVVRSIDPKSAEYDREIHARELSKFPLHVLDALVVFVRRRMRRKMQGLATMLLRPYFLSGRYSTPSQPRKSQHNFVVFPFSLG